MGAAPFAHKVPGTDLVKTFRALREDAAYESGHGGYSGTVAEKFSVLLRVPDPMTLAEARAFVKEDQDENGKWDPAFAVRVKEGDFEGFVIYGLARE